MYLPFIWHWPKSFAPVHCRFLSKSFLVFFSFFSNLCESNLSSTCHWIQRKFCFLGETFKSIWHWFLKSDFETVQTKEGTAKCRLICPRLLDRGWFNFECFSWLKSKLIFQNVSSRGLPFHRGNDLNIYLRLWILVII